MLGEGLRDYEHNIGAFRIISPAISVLYIVFMYIFGLYNSSRQKLPEVLYTVSLISLMLMLSVMAICFFVRGGAMAFPRSVILLSTGLWLIILSIWRFVVWKIAKMKHGKQEVMLVGNDTEQLLNCLNKKYQDIYRVKFIQEQVDDLIKENMKLCDVVFITSNIKEVEREKVFSFASELNLPIYFIPKYSDISIMNASFQQTDDIPTYQISKIELSLEERFVKRTFDIILSSIGFVISLPLFIICAILVKLDRGPVFYSQERLTVNKKMFKMLKFRTMIPDAEKKSGPVLAGDKDPRITSVGRFMRAARLDEIPQILNILKGNMSIVGPRPERPFFVEQFEAEIPEYALRMKTKAGLTGMAQVWGKYNTTAAEKLRYDLIYLNQYSFLQDILIILQTIKILFLKNSTEGVSSSKAVKEKSDFFSEHKA